MALRHPGARSSSQHERVQRKWKRWIPDNRVVRSAILVAVYSAAFFPMSALQGAAAQFVSIVPITIIASWLGMRGGLLVAMGFVPLLTGLSVVAQGERWDYLLLEGRPAAVISLFTMAVIAGKASDTGRKLAIQEQVSDSYITKIEALATDRARLISLGIELANAYSTVDVYRATSSTIGSWVQADRITFLEISEDSARAEIKYVEGVEIQGFEIGTVFEIDDEWQELIEADREVERKTGRTLPYSHLDNWKSAGFNSVLRVPLKNRDKITGYVTISRFQQSDFTDSEHDLLMAAAQQINPHLRAATLFDASVLESGLRRAQSEVARAISMSARLDALCEVAGLQIQALIDVDLGIVAETQQGKNTLTVRKAFGNRGSLVQEDTSFEWDPDFTHLDDEVRYWDLESLEIGEDAYPFSLFASEGFRSVAMVTLMTDGEPIGWMVLASSASSFESVYTSQLMQGVGAHLANAIIKGRVEAEQKRLVRKLAAQNSELRSARAHLQESRNKVEKQNQELQEANQAKNTFLSAVSHELKTPLAIMVGFAELLGMNIHGNLSDQQLEQLRMVERNGRHLDLLVSDLVDVSRIESGRLAVNLEPTDPEEVLTEILTGLDSIAVEKEQVLTRDFDLNGGWVRADRARLGQVVTNLVTNACKYSPAKSEVTISAYIENRELIVIVADQGLGITKEDQKKLFTPFFRSSNEDAQKEKGTGLGLVITRSIVEMHGGTMELESDLGEGTTITVRMPGVMIHGDEDLPSGNSQVDSDQPEVKSSDAA